VRKGKNRCKQVSYKVFHVNRFHTECSTVPCKQVSYKVFHGTLVSHIGWSQQLKATSNLPSLLGFAPERYGTLYLANDIGYTRPAQHTARGPHAARENSVAENVAKARLWIIACPFRISSTLWRNRLLRPAASLCWSIWPFELSELCRPDQHSCAGSAGLQSVSLGGTGAQIRKDLGVAEKV